MNLGLPMCLKPRTAEVAGGSRRARCEFVQHTGECVSCDLSCLSCLRTKDGWEERRGEAREERRERHGKVGHARSGPGGGAGGPDPWYLRTNRMVAIWLQVCSSSRLPSAAAPMSASDASAALVDWFEEEDVVIVRNVRYDLSTEDGYQALIRAGRAENENPPPAQKRRRLRYKQKAQQFD